MRAEFQEPVEQVIGLFFASGRWKGEAIHHRKDGTPIHILGSMSLIKDEQGQPVAVVSTSRDITTRKQAEDMLQKKSDEAEKFFSSALDLLCIADTNGYFRRLNREWEKVLGYRLEELEGRRFLDLVHPDDVAATLAAIGELEANKQVLNFTNRYRCKDGSYRWIEWRSVPSDTDIYAAARDITDRKRVQEALEQSLREKELLMKELQHRVKNSLSVVASLIDLEKWNLTDQHARQVFIDTRSRILSLSAIYEQLYQTGAVDSVDLQTYIQNLADALSASYAPTGGQVRIVTRLSEVQLDLKRSLPLGLILNELITNALKYAYPPGTAGDIRIELERTGGQAILRVSDDGIGMPDFQQGSTDSGLGLKLVDMLVQQIDGSFTIDGRKGTSVSVAFEIQ